MPHTIGLEVNILMGGLTMTVAELIKILQELPQDKTVYDYEGVFIE
jgi:hypothetical protein